MPTILAFTSRLSASEWRVLEALDYTADTAPNRGETIDALADYLGLHERIEAQVARPYDQRLWTVVTVVKRLETLGLLVHDPSGRWYITPLGQVTVGLRHTSLAELRN